jgi:hypothetical protein
MGEPALKIPFALIGNCRRKAPDEGDDPDLS